MADQYPGPVVTAGVFMPVVLFQVFREMRLVTLVLYVESENRDAGAGCVARGWPRRAPLATSH